MARSVDRSVRCRAQARSEPPCAGRSVTHACRARLNIPVDAAANTDLEAVGADDDCNNSCGDKIFSISAVTARAFRAARSPARSHTRRPVNKLCFPLQLKFTFSVTTSRLPAKVVGQVDVIGGRPLIGCHCVNCRSRRSEFAIPTRTRRAEVATS